MNTFEESWVYRQLKIILLLVVWIFKLFLSSSLLKAVIFLKDIVLILKSFLIYIKITTTAQRILHIQFPLLLISYKRGTFVKINETVLICSY